MTTYYVDYTGGSDSNSGTATGDAWKTTGKVHTELGAGTFGSGDEILFKRGETWNVTTYVQVRNCGDITLGYYGSGALPIINAGSNNIWIFYHGIGNASCDGTTIENIDFRNSDKAGIFLEDVNDMTVSGCDFYSCDGAVAFRWGDDNTIDNCNVYSSDSEGLYIGVAYDYTKQSNRAMIRDCYVADCQYEGVDWKEGVYDSTMQDTYIIDAVLVSSSSPPDFIAWGGIRNTCQRVKVVMDDSYTVNGIRVGKYNAWLDPAETETAHIVRQCLFLACTGSFAISVYGDGNFIYDNACINGAGGIEIASSGLGTSNKQTLRGNYFSGNSDDDVSCDNTGMTDSDYNCYADAGSWYIGSSRTLSYVRETYGFEENSRPNIDIAAGTSVYINDIKNVTDGDGMIYVDVTYRSYGVAQHRTSHVMRLGDSSNWRHEILMNLKLYVDRDSDFSTRAADDRDTSIGTDASDPENILADSDVSALIGAETWLYYDVA